MRKLLLSALIVSSPLLAEAATSVKPNDAATLMLESSSIEMKDPFKKQRKQEEKNKKKNPPMAVIGLSTAISAVANGTESQQTVGSGNPVIFNATLLKNGSIDIDEATGIFTASVAGVYEVTYSVNLASFTPGAMIALRVNDAVVPESKIIATQGWHIVTLIVNASANKTTTFAVINDSAEPNSDITLAGDAAGSTSSAFITIKKIN